MPIGRTRIRVAPPHDTGDGEEGGKGVYLLSLYLPYIPYIRILVFFVFLYLSDMCIFRAIRIV